MIERYLVIDIDGAREGLGKIPVALQSAWIPNMHTEMIGNADASARMPKPSVPLSAPSDTPIARMSGTVTGPVVTPAQSQATHTIDSDASSVTAMATA